MKEIIIAYDENTEARPIMGDWVGELVRCKDCRFMIVIDGSCYCDKPNADRLVYRNPEWFCADGIAKDTDVLNK